MHAMVIWKPESFCPSITFVSTGPKDHINIRIPQTMVSGIPLIMGLIMGLGTRMLDAYVYVVFWAPSIVTVWHFSTVLPDQQDANFAWRCFACCLVDAAFKRDIHLTLLNAATCFQEKGSKVKPASKISKAGFDTASKISIVEHIVRNIV